MTDFDDDVRTATEAVREMLVMAGINSPKDLNALHTLFEARWEYGVQWNPDRPDRIYEFGCAPEGHAREWKRDLEAEGPLVRRLVVRHIGGWVPIPEGATP